MLLLESEKLFGASAHCYYWMKRYAYTKDEFAKKMNRCYYRIVEIQEDRRKRTGIRGIISKIKGALFS